MRILWVPFSASPWSPTGFGNVTRFVCHGLARRGHDVHILSWRAAECSKFMGCRIHTVSGRRTGDELCSLLLRLKPDIVIFLGDIWWFPFFVSAEALRLAELINTRLAFYTPIDGDMGDGQLPPSWIEILRQVDLPIAMSRYGQRVMKTCGIPAGYIPHGVDPKIFSPPWNREWAKSRVGYRGRFVILSDCRNQSRKMIPRLLDIFASFASDRPDVLLHLHTDLNDRSKESGIYSYDVMADLRRLGIDLKVRFTPKFNLETGGIPLPKLAAYYRAADVHLLTSTGEGFGLPTLQAAAVGAVPMACAYSASLELTHGHGESIPVSEWIPTEIGIRRALIDVDEAVERLKMFYEDRALLRSRSTQSRRFAQSYSWNDILPQWDDLVRRVGSRPHQAIQQRRTPEPENREAAFEAPTRSGMPVKVMSFSRELRRTEVSIPTTPDGRRFGHLIIADTDVPLFLDLRRLFPILRGWVIGDAPLNAEYERPHGLKFLAEDSEDCHSRLAQATLILNMGNRLSEVTLIDAALCGVPCIGSPKSRAQTDLWPDLVVSQARLALNLARCLLTNAARFHSLVECARISCQRLYVGNSVARQITSTDLEI